mmetsp:Transcript_4753/g.14345  ORF Transcript_4753/g.14345 Transcript_4753/m.14345 type:complete len:202 (+) Transcript_4753:3010-3615(+)
MASRPLSSPQRPQSRRHAAGPSPSLRKRRTATCIRPSSRRSASLSRQSSRRLHMRTSFARCSAQTHTSSLLCIKSCPRRSSSCRCCSLRILPRDCSSSTHMSVSASLVAPCAREPTATIAGSSSRATTLSAWSKPTMRVAASSLCPSCANATWTRKRKLLKQRPRKKTRKTRPQERAELPGLSIWTPLSRSIALQSARSRR